MRLILTFIISIGINVYLPAQIVNDNKDKGETYTLIQSNWAGLSKDSNCIFDVDSRSFDQFLVRAIKRNSNSKEFEFRPSAIHSMDVFMQYFQRLEYGVGTKKIAILPFFICDQEVLTLNIFVFDFSQGKLTNSFSLNVVDNSNSIYQIAQQASEWISKNANQKSKSFISTSVFDACIYKYQLDYFYKLFKHNQENISTQEYEVGKKTYGLPEIKGGLGKYLSTLNYQYCDDLRANLEKEDPTHFTNKLKRHEKSYPNLIKLMTHIDLYEDYQIRNYVDRDQMKKALLLSKKNLFLQSEEMIPKKERKKYHEEFRHYKIIRRLGRATDFLANCENIFQHAQDLESKGFILEASSIYFEILENQDINKYFHQLKFRSGKEEYMICASLKEYSWIELDRIRRLLKYNYNELLEKGDDFWNKQKYDQAFLAYSQADSLNQGLSYYAQSKIKLCSDKIKLREKREYLGFVKMDINSILGKKFNHPDPDIAGGSTRTFKIDEDRITLILENDTLNNYSSNSLYINRNYLKNGIKPFNASPYDARLDNRLVECIIDIYNKYQKEIKEVRINYYGATDTISLTSLDKEEVLDVFEKNILKDTVYSRSLDESFIINKLFKNKNFYNTYGYPSENLLIAYLRARYKRDLHQEKYAPFVPDSIISTYIFPEVALTEDAQYREVKTEISIILSSPSDTPIEEFDLEVIDSTNRLNMKEDSENAFEELDKQPIFVDSFNILNTPFEALIIQEHEIDGKENVLIFPNDQDGDGILDKFDKCPGHYGEWRNKGCPLDLDSDGDGIIDRLDKCPGKYGNKGSDGCPNVSLVKFFKQDRALFFESKKRFFDFSYSFVEYPVYNILENLDPLMYGDSILYPTITSIRDVTTTTTTIDTINNITTTTTITRPKKVTDTTGQVSREIFDLKLNPLEKIYYFNIGINTKTWLLNFDFSQRRSEALSEQKINLTLGSSSYLINSRVQFSISVGPGFTWGEIKKEVIEPYTNSPTSISSGYLYNNIHFNLRSNLRAFLTRSIYLEGVYDYNSYQYPSRNRNSDARLRFLIGFQL